jgi:hypothetical protein
VAKNWESNEESNTANIGDTDINGLWRDEDPTGNQSPQGRFG